MYVRKICKASNQGQDRNESVLDSVIVAPYILTTAVKTQKSPFWRRAG
jgi:hypothetical protein